MASGRRIGSTTVRAWAIVLCCLSIGASANAAEQLRVGSKRFTESYVLGEILRQAAESSGDARVELKSGLGNTGIVYAALRSGEIDIYPEYTGTIAREILKDDTVTTLPEMNARLRALGLAVDVPLGFDNTYALAVRNEDARRLGLEKVSDLARHPNLRYGVSNEFLGRSDGWPGLAKTYVLAQARPRGLDHGLALDALRDGEIDVTDIYSTDAKIEKLGLRVLVDDLHYFPAYDAVLLFRADLPARMPRAWAALQALRGRIDAATMTHLNAEAELANKPFDRVASAWLAGSKGTSAAAQAPSASRSFIGQLFGPDFLRLTAEHVGLVAGSLAAAILLGIPLGIWAAFSARAARPILGIVGIVQTVPALALLAFLIPVFHRIGALPTLVALFLYALLPIVRNTCSGLANIAPGLRESSHGLGLPTFARLRLIDLPLAAPSILAGIKTSAVINVGNATMAAFVGAGGYGERIATGLALNDNVTLLAGAIPAALLALAVDAAFSLAERRYRLEP